MKQIKKTLLLIMFCNIIIAFIKIIIGYFTNSSSILADGFHSFTDGASNIVGIIGIAIASKPVDKNHPYGHKKYETLASLSIVFLLVYIGIRLIVVGISKLTNPTIPTISLITLIIMFITLTINIFITKYEYNIGIKLNSSILVSDSIHTKSDVYITIGVISASIAIKFGMSPVIDGFVSVFIAIFILFSAYEMFKIFSDILVDSIAVEEIRIKKIVMAQENVKGVHKIRSRGTIDDMHIDMHILADSNMNIEKSHELTHKIQDSLRRELNNNVDVIIHLEPYNENFRLLK